MEKIETNNWLKRNTTILVSNNKCNHGNGQKDKKKKKETNPAKISKMQSMCIHTNTSYSSCSQWREQWHDKKRGTSEWGGYRINAACQLWQEALWVTPSTTPEQSGLLSISASSLDTLRLPKGTPSHSEGIYSASLTVISLATYLLLKAQELVGILYS